MMLQGEWRHGSSERSGQYLRYVGGTVLQVERLSVLNFNRFASGVSGVFASHSVIYGNA